MGNNGQKSKQLCLPFDEESRGEAPMASLRVELSMALTDTKRPAIGTRALMERIVDYRNLYRALKRVKANRGSPGIDGMTVRALPDYFQKNCRDLQSALLTGSYRPAPVKRVEIPKPSGGVRQLGIPTVIDRLVQQAVSQALQELYEPTFSDHSYGFRPGRSAHQAIRRSQDYIQSGYSWVVDMDLSKFFDRVNHDRLMGQLAKRIEDKRLLKLIRSFLTAGVLADGLVSSTTEGTPQGGPLSPLLSNIVLDELDKELEQRGHCFVRYADDCNIYVKSHRAGDRVMVSVTRFIEKRLKLKVNTAKSAVDRPAKRTFLGFTFLKYKGEIKRRIAPVSIQRMKRRVREITKRKRTVGFLQILDELNRYLTGWRGYFGFCQTPSVLRDLDSWIRRRIRSLIWKQWKRGKRRFGELIKRGVPPKMAAMGAGSEHGPWRMSRTQAMHMAFGYEFFDKVGLTRLRVPNA